MPTLRELKLGFISDTKSLLEDLKKYNSLSELQINWKPNTETWSIAECVDHLLVTNSLYLKEFEKQFSEKIIKTDSSTVEVKHKLISKFIIRSVHPDNKKASKTFPVFKRTSSNYSKDVFGRFEQLQNKLLFLVNSAEDLNLNKYVMSSPASKLIKESFSDVLEIIRLHDRRHFNQIERIYNHPNFPKE